jgi:hypothetical protein
MQEENTFAGAGLATTFLVNGLITSLVEKGILTPGERDALFDAILVTMEESQCADFPANAEIWTNARRHIKILAQSHLG